jgi:transcriptional regulator with XRE-family HTH domain
MSSNIKRFGGEILRFKECREKAGLSQREVGDRLGISDSAVCLWEREQGGSLPRASMLPAIAKLYGVTVDELLSDHDEG